MEPRDETPIDVVIEMCVYAPLGFALEARSLLPRFVERGRNQVAMARVVGKFAARKGREELEGRVEESQAMVIGLLELTGVVNSPGGASTNGSHSETTTDGSDAPSTAAAVVTTQAEAAAPSRASSAEADPDAPDEASLAIPGYGSLAASQVVPRLASLSADELDAVSRFEAANRGRRTILNRIAQLQSS